MDFVSSALASTPPARPHFHGTVTGECRAAIVLEAPKERRSSRLQGHAEWLARQMPIAPRVAGTSRVCWFVGEGKVCVLRETIAFLCACMLALHVQASTSSSMGMCVCVRKCQGRRQCEEWAVDYLKHLRRLAQSWAHHTRAAISTNSARRPGVECQLWDHPHHDVRVAVVLVIFVRKGACLERAPACARSEVHLSHMSRLTLFGAISSATQDEWCVSSGRRDSLGLGGPAIGVRSGIVLSCVRERVGSSTDSLNMVSSWWGFLVLSLRERVPPPRGSSK